MWHSDEDYTCGLAAFISEGLAADEPVMAAVLPSHRKSLTDALGAEAEQVAFLDMTELGANPARIIPAWQKFLDTHPGRPVRGIGEPIWPGRRPVETTESQLHEALLNVAVDPKVPFWLLCPYDVERLDPDLIAEAHRSHPVIVEADGLHGSPSYTGRAHVDRLFATSLPDPGTTPITTTVSAANTERIAAYVRLEAYVAGLSTEKADQLAQAAQQLAWGSLRRGAEQVTVRIWSEGDAVACELADGTAVTDPLHGRRIPLGDEHEGLWLANQLCDLVQLRSTTDGTTIRLHAWR